MGCDEEAAVEVRVDCVAAELMTMDVAVEEAAININNTAILLT